MFRHFITGVNVRKLIEMQSKNVQRRLVHKKDVVQPTSGKKFVKKFQRID